MKRIVEINKEFDTIGVKGITPVRVERLAKIMEGERSRLDKKMGKSLALAGKYRSEAKTIETELRALQDDIERLFGRKEINISLLHKKSSGSSYIKGRCWWNGKQREVQIGSIRSVLTMVNHMIAGGIIDYLKPVEDFDLTWEKLKSREKLVRAIREIGKIKFRKYMIGKLLAERSDLVSESETYNEIPVDLEFGRPVDTDLNIPDEAAADDWYEQWSRDNLNS